MNAPSILRRILTYQPSAALHRVAVGLGFSLLLALAATFLKGTIVGSSSETRPLTLLFFLAIAGALRLVVRPRATAALGLTLVLLAPLVLQIRPWLGSFSTSSSFRCEGWSTDMDRVAAVVFFPLNEPWLTASAIALAALAFWLVAWGRWRALGPALRWMAVVAGIAAELWLLRYRGRPEAEAHLAAKPVVATLFPTAEVAAKKPEEYDRRYPTMEVGPLSVYRSCDPGQNPDCTVHFEPLGRPRRFSGVEVGCVKESQRVVLRRDDTLDLWFLDKEGTRYAFRLGDGPQPLAWTEITRSELLPYTCPPRGWLLTPALAVAVALYAGLRRRLARRHLRALELGVEGVAAGGRIELPGGTTLRVPEGRAVPDGPVVVQGPVPASAADYRGDPMPPAGRVWSGTRAALTEATRMAGLDWDLHAVAVVVLALLVVSPWLRFSLAHP
jgi:hypothetical protein